MKKTAEWDESLLNLLKNRSLLTEISYAHPKRQHWLMNLAEMAAHWRYVKLSSQSTEWILLSSTRSKKAERKAR